MLVFRGVVFFRSQGCIGVYDIYIYMLLAYLFGGYFDLL